MQNNGCVRYSFNMYQHNDFIQVNYCLKHVKLDRLENDLADLALKTRENTSDVGIDVLTRGKEGFNLCFWSLR